MPGELSTGTGQRLVLYDGGLPSLFKILALSPIFPRRSLPLNRSLDPQLFALSAVDGRYRSKLEALSPLVSEAGLISYRLRVEAEWLLHLAAVPELASELRLNPKVQDALRRLIENVPEAACARVKTLEQTTNHDVKAVEYYLRETLSEAGADPRTLAFIHFACTSEDINNLAYALMLADARKSVIGPAMQEIIAQLEDMTRSYRDLPMLARTHGQTASPTTLGKELAVFAHRLRRQVSQLKDVALEGKMSGAVGNYNAHWAAYPELDWVEIARRFIEDRLGLTQNLLTTQIENHDSMVEFAGAISRFNTILIGLCRDIWSYISIDYFKQETKAGEIGSSTMPHKVNPIDFENAEGNCGVANALAQHFAEKLPISRWQRDLTDSTVQRTWGTFLAHSLLAYLSLSKGLSKIKANPPVIAKDLAQAPEVLGEAIQTCMRRYGVVDAYERLKQATRGQKVEHADLVKLIEGCAELPLEAKKRLQAMTPDLYVGLAAQLVDLYFERENAHATARP